MLFNIFIIAMRLVAFGFALAFGYLAITNGVDLSVQMVQDLVDCSLKTMIVQNWLWVIMETITAVMTVFFLKIATLKA